MRVTRRGAARILAGAAGAAAVRARAQAPPVAAAAKPTADQDLERARQSLRSSAAQLARVPLPMSVEPAFRFRP